MAAGLTEQIERHLAAMIATGLGATPWRFRRKSSRSVKTTKHRRERRRAKADPDCFNDYRRYRGYEF